jgi:DNA polymerase III subunit delta'
VGGDSTTKAPLFDTLRGQDVAVQTLRRAVASGRVHHAYVFEGPGGVGKKLAAFGLAQALVCEARAEGALACGACSACIRAVPVARASGLARPTHPDITLLGLGFYDPQLIGRKTAETSEISVDQIRTLVLARGAFGPHEGRAKVFIVDDAEGLSVAASNALLKTLEEPPQRTHFVLVSSRPKAMLSTIRSRTLAVRFRPLSEAVMEQCLAPEHPARSFLHACGGSMDNANALVQANGMALLDPLDEALTSESLEAGLKAAAAAKGKREDVETALMLLGAREALRAQTASTPTAALKHAQRHLLISQATQSLYRNMSPQLCLESLMIAARR